MTEPVKLHSSILFRVVYTCTSRGTIEATSREDALQMAHAERRAMQKSCHHGETVMVTSLKEVGQEPSSADPPSNRIHLQNGARIDVWPHSENGAGIGLHGEETATQHLTFNELERLYQALERILYPT